MTGRSYIVDVNGERSTEAFTTYGVPQGSILGPFLFLVMINDLPCNVHAKSILYADDSTFIITGNNINTIKDTSRDVSTDVTKWFSSNGFLVNKEKTQQTIFTLKENRDKVNVKLLGFHLDSALNWHVHVDSICKRLSRVVYLLRSICDKVPRFFIKQIYFGLFESVFKYGLLLYGNSTKLMEILLLQKKAIRILSNSPGRTHCKPLFIQEGILTVFNYYIFELLLYVHKNKNELILNNHVHPYNVRNIGKIQVPFSRLEKVKSSHLVNSIRLYNKLPIQLTELNVNSFKGKIKIWLCNNPFYSLTEYMDSSFNM